MQLVRLTLFALLGFGLGYLLVSRTEMELQDWLLLVGLLTLPPCVYLSLRGK